jgi:hypothetical protein
MTLVMWTIAGGVGLRSTVVAEGARRRPATVAKWPREDPEAVGSGAAADEAVVEGPVARRVETLARGTRLGEAHGGPGPGCERRRSDRFGDQLIARKPA